MKRFIPFLVLIVVLILSFVFPSIEISQVTGTHFDSGDIAWMLISVALVLIMTPGLAFFYGGMVNKKNVISTMLQSLISMVIITVMWVVFGFSLAFGKSIGGFIGNPSTYFMMKGMLGSAVWPGATTIPLVLFAMYQLKFAIITPALFTGAFAERIRFNSYLIFLILFSIFIYSPLAHCTWHPNGYLAKMGVLDFAGGTVVHMSAGWAALASALYLKRRHEANHAPARITYVIIGTGLLWFGWFGFNAGSALSASPLAATALATTTTAASAAGLAWVFFDMMRGRKPSAMGTCIGAVVGLVAITPAAGYVSIPHSLAIGIISAVVSNLVVELRTRTSIDDTLDVFPCHGVGGMVGMLLTGVFAHHNVNPLVNADGKSGNGLVFGDTHLFIVQLTALVMVSVFAFFGSLLLLKITDMISPLRVSMEDETVGLDISQHGEKL
ncbi:ammonium transporter [Mucilaginibacter robiniae]|uniref:Ammonium transporter n=1 Tax=Mucilaginibacter robiniae TaxID=2728022 RepID=A0A7L5DZG1_9SPHI|nr:ammonium transporter [Mucilaginibacter robiniae]QJD94664.1 ammonium transporter [Mucilaginibacter robiniae]